MRIYQILPYLDFGTAVSNDAIAIKKLLSECGYETQNDKVKALFWKYMDGLIGENKLICKH